MNEQWPNGKDMRAQDTQTPTFHSHGYLVEAALDSEWEENYRNGKRHRPAGHSETDFSLLRNKLEGTIEEESRK